MQKAEKIFVTVIAIAIIAILAHGIWRKTRIDKAPVYVKAKVYAIRDTENGPIYYSRYVYDSIEYKSNLKAFIDMDDSTIILKISKSNPKFWTHVDRVP